MEDKVKKQLIILERKEQRLVGSSRKKQRSSLKKENGLMEKVQSKIPKQLTETLEAAFQKAFWTVFEKGTGVIEKTFDKKRISYTHEMQERLFKEEGSRKRLRELDSASKRMKWKNLSMTALEGGGLGLLGVGLPDIPLFIGILLKGIYEVALSYGFEYESKEERLYILSLISAALSDEEDCCQHMNQAEKCLMENVIPAWDMEQEIAGTSKILSEKMLTAKFIQGLPVAGVLGGISNAAVYQKVIDFAMLKYKKRYLMGLIKE